jgi:hypothetical protein
MCSEGWAFPVFWLPLWYLQTLLPTNINKTNNQLSPQIVKHKKKPGNKALEIQALFLDRHKNVVGLDWLMEIIQGNNLTVISLYYLH